MNERIRPNGMQQDESAAIEQAAVEVKEKAGETAERAKRQAQEAAAQAQDEARDALSRQKNSAAAELDGVAHALRQTSNQLHRQDQDVFAEYGHRMADQVERASSYLEEHELDELVDDAQQFARSQPELFLGGAFTLGLLAARFLKSSAPRTRQTTSYPPTRYTQTRAVDYPTGPRYGRPSSGPSTGEARSNQ